MRSILEPSETLHEEDLTLGHDIEEKDDTKETEVDAQVSIIEIDLQMPDGIGGQS